MVVKQRVSAVAFDDGVAADIEGFDFASYDKHDIAPVRDAWLKYGVIRFRQTRITDQEQVEFSRHFGAFVIHPKQHQEGGHPTVPEILVISNVMKDGKPAGALGNSEATWHTDTWFYERPPAGAILRAIELPPSGGDTYFLSTYRAYDTLPAALRAVVTGRQIFFQNIYDKTGKLRHGKSAPKSSDFREWSGIVHPLVRTHGESGRKALYLGGTSDKVWIVGLPLDESDDILAQLWRHTTSTDRVFVQTWSKGDIVMWDNRCTMHRRDSFDPRTIRIMHRTTTAGERPV
jgi:alpha-ketoglutarate-dependent taurine dioxygenase